MASYVCGLICYVISEIWSVDEFRVPAARGALAAPKGRFCGFFWVWGVAVVSVVSFLSRFSRSGCLEFFYLGIGFLRLAVRSFQADSCLSVEEGA